jgi:hypothetical protein
LFPPPSLAFFAEAFLWSAAARLKAQSAIAVVPIGAMLDRDRLCRSELPTRSWINN